jgi:hypothetical protein
MCILVIVGKYSCGHTRSPEHAIPDEFIRDCHDRSSRRCHDLFPNEEDIPWFCPDCHWDYVKVNLEPLWQQATVTKCRMMKDVQMYPAEPAYLNAQHEADHLEITFKAQQDAIIRTTNSFHELRDSTLRGFMAENFRSCLRHAYNDHRPWTLSYLREPFARSKADSDLDPQSGLPPAYVDVENPGSSPVESDQGDVLVDLSNVVTDQGVEDPDVHSDISFPDSTFPSSTTGNRSTAQDEELGCRWCTNCGSAAGVTVDQRVCTTCRLEQSEDNYFGVDGLNSMLHSVNADVARCNTRGHDAEYPLPGAGNQSNPHAANQFNSHAEGARLVLEEISTGPTDSPTMIPSEIRDAVESYIAEYREDEVLVDGVGHDLVVHIDPLAGGQARIWGREVPYQDPGLNDAAYERALLSGGILTDADIQHDCRGQASSARDELYESESAYPYEEDYEDGYQRERPQQQRRRPGVAEGSGRRSRRREGRRQQGSR